MGSENGSDCPLILGLNRSQAGGPAVHRLFMLANPLYPSPYSNTDERGTEMSSPCRGLQPKPTQTRTPPQSPKDVPIPINSIRFVNTSSRSLTT